MALSFANENGPVGAVIVIQYNWDENISNNEKAWVYYKKLNEKSIHGYTGDRTFNVISKTKRTIVICHVLSDKRTRFICPIQKFGKTHSQSILSIDVSDGGLGISVSTDNKMNLWQTSNGEVRRHLDGHLFDVYSCRLFPSGIVVLSGGADMQIKIWDVATGVCPVTLKGHTAAVTDTCIVEKGKNIISVSKDGTARLWNCAESKCVEILLQIEAEINCCSLIDVGNKIKLHEENDDVMIGELEFDTKSKLLACGCADGKVFLVGVASKEIIITHFLTSAVMSLCWLPTLILVIGLEDGSIMTIDAQVPQQVPQLLNHDSASAVLCIAQLNGGFLVGRRDGLCQYYTNGNSSMQLTGPDCDPVYDIATDKEHIYTACRDAVIRKYLISDLDA